MKLKAWQKIALWIVGLPLLLVLLLAALPTHDEPVIPDADLKVLNIAAVFCESFKR